MDVSTYFNGGEETQWFPIGTTDAELQIYFMKPKEFDRILNNSKRGGRSLGVDVDENTMKDILDKMVVGWKNITDGVDDKGESVDLPCTKINKIKCDQHWMKFRKTWRDLFLDYVEGVEIEREEIAKNSPSGLSTS